MKFALKIIGRMKPAWARRALREKTWSKTDYWFVDCIP